MKHSTFKMLLACNGIWRAVIETVSPGVVCVYVPKNRISRFRDIECKYLPMGIQFDVKVLHNPIRFKKYSYEFLG